VSGAAAHSVSLAAPPRTRLATAGALVAIALVAMWTRGAFIVVLGGLEPDYVEWAMRHYFGGITARAQHMGELLIGGTWPVQLAMPHGYPLLLGAAARLGLGDLQALRFVQAAADATAIVPIHLILRRLGARPACALLGPALYALLPLFAGGCTFILAESLAPVAFAWLLLLFARVLEEGRLVPAILTGAVTALAALLRSEMILLGAYLPALVLVAGRHRRIRSALLIAAACALPLAPVGLGNLVHNGRFIVTSNCGNYAIYCGLAQVPGAHEIVANDALWRERLEGRGILWHSIEANEHFRGEVRAILRDDPWRYPRGVLERWRRILLTAESFAPTPASAERLQAAMTAAAPAAIALALVLLVARRGEGRLRRAIVLLLPMACALGSIGLVYYEPRYVRYAQLSALIAVPIAADAITRLAAIAAGGGADAVRARAAGIASAAILWLALAAAALPALVALAARAGDARDAATWRAGGLAGLGTVNALDELPWQILSAAAHLTRDGAGHLLVTDERGGAYQMAADLPADGVRGYGVVADVEIMEGGVTIGGLAGVDGRWLASESVGIAGRNRLRAYVPAGAADGVRLVVANFRFGGGASRIRFERFTVTAIAPPDAQAGAPDPLAALRASAADARLAEAWRTNEVPEDRLRAVALRWTTYGAGTAWARREPADRAASGPWDLVTDDRPAAYQIGADVPTSGAAGVGVAAEVEVREGAVTIGALSGRTGRWIVAQSAAEGAHTLRLFVPARGESTVRIVIANERPEGGRSRVAVEALRVVTIGAEDGATEGAGAVPSGPLPGPRNAHDRER
jgi:hypothetical protein